jgi:hypothetical protein
MRIAALALALSLVAPSIARAEPYEFFACKFREGKTMADFDAWLPKFKAAASKVKDGSTVVILTPMYAENAPDFYWMGWYPDGAKFGIGLRDYFEKGIGDEVEAALAQIVDCSASASLWLGRTVYQQKD